MEQQTSTMMKRRLDSTLMSMTGTIKEDIYQGVILPTVHEWFDSSDSIKTLSETIENNVKRRVDFLSKSP